MKARLHLGAFLVGLFVLLVIGAMPVAAAPGAGSSPQLAHPLGSGLNVGTLAPGETFWYVLDREQGNPPARMVVLNLIYRPGEHDVAPYVNFQILAADQVDRWLQGYADAYLGMGVFTTTDFDQNSSERLWSGSLLKDQVYYVRLFNNSSQPVEFHLMALSQPLDLPVVERQARLVEPDTGAAATADVLVEPAASQTNVEQVAPLGILKPGATQEETRWRLVTAVIKSLPAEEAVAWLTMASQVGWLPGEQSGAQAAMQPAGSQPAAQSVPAAAQVPDAHVSETAALPQQTLAEHTAPEVSAPQAPAKVPEAKPVDLHELYPDVYPTTPLVLHNGPNVGRLAPGGEHWYTFVSHEDQDKQMLAKLALTMFTTPTDGNTSHLINFQIYPGNQLHIWQRGTPQDMVPMGQGEWVSRDNDPVTGERLWSGTVVNGDRYYVRVVNGSQQVIDYYLITNDVINTELGERVWAANPVTRYNLYQY